MSSACLACTPSTADKTKCEKDEHCLDGRRCDFSGECVPACFGPSDCALPQECVDIDGSRGGFCWSADADTQNDTVVNRKWIEIAAGPAHACAIDSLGDMRCWGEGGDGQTKVPTGSYVAVCVGRSHTCALTSEREVVCFGDNFSGQTTAPGGKGFRAIACGEKMTCAIDNHGQVLCAGANSYGMTVDPPPEMPEPKELACGLDSCCVLDMTGLPFCWGDGLGNTPQAAGLQGLEAGPEDLCALTVEGQIVCWGYDYDYDDARPPSGVGFTAVTHGDSHACALNEAGRATCWPVGTPCDSACTPPVDTRFSRISASDACTCGVDIKGQLACFGEWFNSACDLPPAL